MSGGHKMESIGEIIRRVLARQGYEKGIKEGEVIGSWEEIVGEKIASQAKAVLSLIHI